MDPGGWAGIVMGALGLILAMVAIRRPPRRILPSGRDETADHEYLLELEKHIAILTRERDALMVANLELKRKVEQDCGPSGRLTQKTMLFISGEPLESAITQGDLEAIQRVRGPRGERLLYQRVINASKQDVVDAIQRGQDEHRPFRWLHIASHAGPEGIKLADGVANGKFWLENLPGVRGVMLASCTNGRVADHFVGLVDFVVVVYEDIETRLAARFTHAFWENFLRLGNPDDAYNAAIEQVPQVASYTDIRHS